MQYLLIFCIFVLTGICFDFLRLILTKAFSFEVEEFSFFMGPKLFSCTIGTTEFSFKAIPLGSYIKIKDTFFEASRLSRIIVTYLPQILLIMASFYVLTTSYNYVYTMASKLLILINGIQVLSSILFDKAYVFYRYNK